MLEKAEAGCFNELCNDAGEWIGEQAAENAVCERAMRRQMEIDREKAEQERNARKKTYAFEVPGGTDSGAESDVERLYNNLMK